MNKVLATPLSTAPRHYDLDWLRVLAFSLLIFYHTGMFFVSWDWHIKNNVLSETIKFPMIFISQWRMSLLFLISGAGVYFALGRRSGRSFATERTKRILLPLVFGMFVIVPPQIYFERLTQGTTFSYGNFYKTVFDFIPYPAGSFSWHHLWYLAYIFAYSLILLPLFLYLRSERSRTVRETIARYLSKPVLLILIPTLWLWVRDYYLDDLWPSTHNFTKDWANHYQYFFIFILGFTLVSHPLYLQVIVAKRKLWLVLALVCVPIAYDDYWNIDPKYVTTAFSMLDEFVNAMHRWLWLLTMLGFARYYLNFTNRFLAYANQAVYPFYILHQTIIVTIAYFLIHSQAPVAFKFTVISLGTFVSTALVYELLIRRINILRLLFGLKPLPDQVNNEAKMDATDAVSQQLPA